MVSSTVRTERRHIPGTYYLPDGVSSNDVLDSKQIKSLNKGHKASVKATDLFNCYGQKGMVSIQATNGGLLSGPPPDTEHGQNQSIHDAVLWFEKTRFHHKETSLTSTHYLHFSAPNTLSQSASASSINLISGVCLFSGKVLASSIPDKEYGLNASALERAEPTIYELENIARVAPAIADVVASFNTNHGHPRHELNTCLDIPSFHYYHTVDERLRDGLCTFPEALRWMDAVEKRHFRISRVFRRYIQHELARRSWHWKKSEYRIELSSSGSPGFMCDILRQSLRGCILPSPDHVLRRISEHDPIWDTFFRLISEKERPRDFQSLGYLFHVYYVVRPVLLDATTRGHNSTNPSNPLVISIDDIHERRIYHRAQQLLKKIRTMPDHSVTPNLLEIYSCRRIFTDSNQSRTNLFYRDLSPEQLPVHPCRCGSVLATLRNVNGRGGQNGDVMLKNGTGKGKISPFGVVGMLYGSEGGAALREICMKEGLIF